MAFSVLKDRQGPDWPLGLIIVPTPGTPVNIMSLVDANNFNDPSKPSNTNTAEYTERFNQILFQALHAGTGNNGLIPNNNNVYIVRQPQGTGTGNRSDYGAIVAMLQPGDSFFLTSSPLNRDVFSPYRYRIDADSANDACLVTGFIG